jgi:hypothetical protein
MNHLIIDPAIIGISIARKALNEYHNSSWRKAHRHLAAEVEMGTLRKRVNFSGYARNHNILTIATIVGIAYTVVAFVISLFS